jgi:hypothetical protein
MNSILVADQFRFFTSYIQWNELSPLTKCYVTDLIVPSYDLNKTPIHILHNQYKLKIWILIACPNELVLDYIVKNIPIVHGFFFRSQPLQVPPQLFEFFSTTKTLKEKLPSHFKIGWYFQWNQYPFSPKHFGWQKKNELSRPYLPPLESILDFCFINWQSFLKPDQFRVYMKRLLQLRIPSQIIIVPYIPEKPIDLYKENAGGITTQHLSNDVVPYFFPLVTPNWFQPPSSRKSINRTISSER